MTVRPVTLINSNTRLLVWRRMKQKKTIFSQNSTDMDQLGAFHVNDWRLSPMLWVSVSCYKKVKNVPSRYLGISLTITV